VYYWFLVFYCGIKLRLRVVNNVAIDFVARARYNLRTN
jgi:hypothetical protein